MSSICLFHSRSCFYFYGLCESVPDLKASILNKMETIQYKPNPVEV